MTKQSNYDTLLASVNECVTRCNDAIATYDKQKCVDATNSERKAINKKLRKELRIARAKTQLKRASALRELLQACDNNHALLNACSKFTLAMCSMLSEAQERETFVIARNDNMMSLIMRYDNFSMKKVDAYCKKHNIVLRKDKTFDFTNAIDVVDSIDDVDDDDSDSDE